MNTYFRILSLAVCLLTFSSTSMTARNTENVIKTSLKHNRFETIQSSADNRFVLMVDKFTGVVWMYEETGEQGTWVEIPKKMVYEDGRVYYKLDSHTKSDYNRYQLKFIDGEIYQCLLLDTDFGHVWELAYDNNKGWVFNFCPRIE